MRKDLSGMNNFKFLAHQTFAKQAEICEIHKSTSSKCFSGESNQIQLIINTNRFFTCFFLLWLRTWVWMLPLSQFLHLIMLKFSKKWGPKGQFGSVLGPNYTIWYLRSGSRDSNFEAKVGITRRQKQNVCYFPKNPHIVWQIGNLVLFWAKIG